MRWPSRFLNAVGIKLTHYRNLREIIVSILESLHSLVDHQTGSERIAVHVGGAGNRRRILRLRCRPLRKRQLRSARQGQ